MVPAWLDSSYRKTSTGRAVSTLLISRQPSRILTSSLATVNSSYTFQITPPLRHRHYSLAFPSQLAPTFCTDVGILVTLSYHCWSSPLARRSSPSTPLLPLGRLPHRCNRGSDRQSTRSPGDMMDLIPGFTILLHLTNKLTRRHRYDGVLIYRSCYMIPAISL